MALHRTALIAVLISLMAMLGGAGTAIAGTPDTMSLMTGGLTGPTGVTTVTFANLSSSGNRYVADPQARQVMVVASDGTVDVLAGDPTATTLGDGGAAGVAMLNAPTGIAVDRHGNVYIADTLNHRVRKIVANKSGNVTKNNEIRTVAGNGAAGFSGDGSEAVLASLKGPTGVAVDAADNIYIADNGNYRVRKVDPSGKISTIAGDGAPTTLTAYAVAVVPTTLLSGDLYIADPGNNRILKMGALKGVVDEKAQLERVAGTGSPGYSGDGGLARLARLNQPSGVATDGVDLYVADTSNNCVRKVSISSNVISTRVGTTPQAAIDPTKQVPALPALKAPIGIALDAAGNLYVADSGNGRVEQIYAGISAVTTASPPGGVYTKEQTITLTSSRAVRNILYTLDGSNPHLSGTSYSGPFSVSRTTSATGTVTLKYASVDAAGDKEVVNTATYTFDQTAPVSTATFSGGVLTGGIIVSTEAAIAVKLTATDPSAPASDPPPAIYYTTDGSAPTTASARYTLPISIPVTDKVTSVTIKFFAVDAAGNSELVNSATYSTVALVTTASPPGGTYGAARTVTLSASSPSAVIYFTTDGSLPSTSSLRYSTPLTISSSTTLRYFAQDGAGSEPVKTQSYTIVKLATTATPAGGIFASPQNVTLSANAPGATIYYTVDGKPATTASRLYSTPIPIIGSKTTTLRYFAVDSAGTAELEKTQYYMIKTVPPATAAACDPASGELTFTTGDPSDRVLYRLNGGAVTEYRNRAVAIPDNAIVKYFGVDTAGNTEPMKVFPCASTTAKPALLLETLPDGATTSNGTLYIAGNVAPFETASVSITVNGTPAEAVKVNPTDGSFACKVALRSGDNEISTTASSSGLNEIDKRTIHVVAPAAAPVFTVAYPSDNVTVKSPSIPVSGTTNATVTKVHVRNLTTSADQNVVMAGSGFTANVALAHGPNTITVDAIDLTGSTLPTVTRHVTYDQEGPALYVTSPGNDADSTSANITVAGLASNSAPPVTSSYLLSDATAGSISLATDGSFSQNVTFKTPLPGRGTILISATDSTGSTSTVERTVTFNPPLGTVTPGIGAANGVEAFSMRLPLTLTSGYQAAAVSLDIGYDPNHLSNPRVLLAPAAQAVRKTVAGNLVAPGVFRVLIRGSEQQAEGLTPLPDGELAYVIFDLARIKPGSITVTNVGSGTDSDSHTLPVSGKNGVANIMPKPGDRNGDGAVTISEVQSALNMVLDPANNPTDGTMDLDANGEVSISELQKVVNSFLAL